MITADGNAPGALVIGGHFQGLGVVRSLARRGVPVYILDKELCIGRFSKYIEKSIRCPDVREEKTFLNFLIHLAAREGLEGWVVFPTDDETVSFLSRYKATLESCYRITTPDWKVVKFTYDKKLTHQVAECHDIPIPKTIYPQRIDDLEYLEIDFPVLIKPSIVKNFFNVTKRKLYQVNNRRELLDRYEQTRAIIAPSEIMIQELIPGGPQYLFSFCPLFKDGKVLASVVARRARQHPMDFGHASTFAETVVIPELEELGKRILQSIGFYGICEVEFKQDPRDGIYKLLDINARIWGWHTLAIRAGVDFPYLLYQDMIGTNISASTCAKGVKWMHLTTDIPTAFAEILRGKMSIRDYVRSVQGKKELAVWTADDPLPFLAELLSIPYLWKKRGF